MSSFIILILFPEPRPPVASDRLCLTQPQFTPDGQQLVAIPDGPGGITIYDLKLSKKPLYVAELYGFKGKR